MRTTAVAPAPTRPPTLSELPYCVIDLESTGGSPASARITEIGAVRLRGLRVEERFSSLVDPGCAVPEAVATLTGIDSAMVAGQPGAATVLGRLVDFIGDDVVVAHDAIWDLRLLNVELSAAGHEPLTNRWLDTLAAARHLIDPAEVGRFDLATLAGWAGAGVAPRHRALPDAEATAALLVRLIARAAGREIGDLDHLHRATGVIAPERVGRLLLAEHLPKRRGTFVLRDREGRALHVASAPSIRRRVARLLSPRARLAPHLAAAVAGTARVEHTLQHSALAAALERVELERRLRPRHPEPAPGMRYLVVRPHGPVEVLAWSQLPADPLAVAGPFVQGDTLRRAHRALRRIFPRGGPPAAAALEGGWPPTALRGLAGGGDAAAVVQVVAAAMAVRRAHRRAVVLVEAGPAPGWVELIAAAGGRPVAGRVVPAAGWRPAVVDLLGRLRAAGSPPWPLSPEAWRRARPLEERIAQRGSHPAAIHLAEGWTVAEACAGVGRAIAALGAPRGR